MSVTGSKVYLLPDIAKTNITWGVPAKNSEPHLIVTKHQTNPDGEIFCKITSQCASECQGYERHRNNVELSQTERD